MKVRSQRWKAIEKILRQNRVSGQEELLNFLGIQGFEVTQATLSRDLRGLRVSRVPDQEKGYIYALPEDDEVSEKEFVQDFLRSYLSMESSGNLVVVKTLPGHASVLAWALDNLEVPGVMGTVAGDDTVLVILRMGEVFSDFCKNIKVKIPSWEV